MADLKLRMSCDAAVLTPLVEGRVRFEGIDLQIERVAPRERHHRMLHELPWDICEYSSVNYLTGFESGLPFAAVPVFPLKTFRHRDIWTSEKAGITDPSQLNGKRIGIQNWDNSAALWQRGVLAQDHEVDLKSVEWVCLMPPEAQSFTPPAWLKYSVVPKGTKLEEMLLDGQIAAMMVPFPPQWPAGREGEARRLFPNPVQAEQAYFARHGVIPIMHTIVVKTDLLAREGWVARSVHDGVARAIEIFVSEKRADPAAPSLLWPRLTWKEQEEKVGAQPWPAGVDANRPGLETAIDYALEQGLIARRVSPEELFVEA